MREKEIVEIWPMCVMNNNIYRIKIEWCAHPQNVLLDFFLGKNAKNESIH